MKYFMKDQVNTQKKMQKIANEVCCIENEAHPAGVILAGSQFLAGKKAPKREY